jgi:hypothetical protein
MLYEGFCQFCFSSLWWSIFDYWLVVVLNNAKKLRVLVPEFCFTNKLSFHLLRLSWTASYMHNEFQCTLDCAKNEWLCSEGERKDRFPDFYSMFILTAILALTALPCLALVQQGVEENTGGGWRAKQM